MRLIGVARGLGPLPDTGGQPDATERYAGERTGAARIGRHRGDGAAEAIAPPGSRSPPPEDRDPPARPDGQRAGQHQQAASTRVSATAVRTPITARSPR